MESFSNIILKNPRHIAWVGDYADQYEQEDITNNKLTLRKLKSLHKKAWNCKKEIVMEYRPLNTKYMLLVNWTKKQYVSMYDYIEKNAINGWCLHPLSLLTAIGNGLGGGDYHGINEDKIGIWAFDEISFESSDIESRLERNKFEKIELEFKEN